MTTKAEDAQAEAQKWLNYAPIASGCSLARGL